MAEATFQQFISIFESFFFDLLRLWLSNYPRNLLGKQVNFEDILNAPDKDAIVLAEVDKEVIRLAYKRPSDWFAYLEDKAKLGRPTANEIERFAEAKATRDVFIHNRGTVSKVYESKAGKLARFKDGERIEISEAYHRETWTLLCKLVVDVADAALAKAT